MLSAARSHSRRSGTTLVDRRAGTGNIQILWFSFLTADGPDRGNSFVPWGMYYTPADQVARRMETLA